MRNQITLNLLDRRHTLVSTLSFLFIEFHDAYKMISPEQGRFLSLLSKIKKPKKILEIGCFTGYSALCLAEGLIENGQIDSLDIDEKPLKIAKGYFELANLPIRYNLINCSFED